VSEITNDERRRRVDEYNAARAALPVSDQDKLFNGTARGVEAARMDVARNAKRQVDESLAGLDRLHMQYRAAWIQAERASRAYVEVSGDTVVLPPGLKEKPFNVIPSKEWFNT
jgi:hypothetical protein